MPDDMFPGERFALQVIHPGSPVLRIRYRSGILVAPNGVPDWLLYARAIVELPAVPDGLTRDEARVTDVLTANEVMLDTGDPLWQFTGADFAARTPPGWTWAHLVEGRQVALVPAELHGSYRHIGGVNMLRGSVSGAGLRTDWDPRPVPRRSAESLSEDLVVELEKRLGYRLPQRYRAFLIETNGPVPTEPGVHENFGLVVDQPWFGLAREDRHQDLIYANNWLADRFTDEFLAVAPVQGGLLAVKVRGDDSDSIWFWDDDDPRDNDAFDAGYICEHLLYRVADDVTRLWDELALPAAGLLEVMDAMVRGGAREIRPELAGAWLPANRRAPWQTGPAAGVGDELLADLDASKGGR